MTGPTPLIVFNFLEMFTNQENLHKNLDFQLFFFKTRSDNTGSASLGSDGLEKRALVSSALRGKEAWLRSVISPGEREDPPLRDS